MTALNRSTRGLLKRRSPICWVPGPHWRGGVALDQAAAALHIVAPYVPEIFADSIVPLHAELAACATNSPTSRDKHLTKFVGVRSEPAGLLSAMKPQPKGTANEEKTMFFPRNF